MKLFALSILIFFIVIPAIVGIIYIFPILKPYTFDFIAFVYLLFSIYYLFVFLFEAYSLYSRSRTRREGGCSSEVMSIVIRANMNYFKQLRHYVSLFSIFVANILAWPSVVIVRLYFKFSSKNLNISKIIYTSNIREIIVKVNLSQMINLCWQLGVMFLISILAFCIVMYIHPYYEISNYLFWIFITYANFVLLFFAVSPQDIAMHLRKQPFNALIILTLMILFLSGIFIFSFSGILLNSNFSAIEILKSTSINFIHIDNIWNLISHKSWLIIDAWLTISGILFSIVLIELLFHLNRMKRSDNDYLTISQLYLRIDDIKSAEKWLSNIKSQNNDTLIIKAIINYKNGNKLKAREQIRQSIFLDTHNWSRSPKNSEIAYLKTIKLIMIDSSENFFKEIFKEFLSINQQSTAYIQVALVQYCWGKMNWTDIFKEFKDILHLPKGELLHAYLLLASGQQSESRKVIEDISTLYASSDACMLYLLKLEANTSKDLSKKQKLKYIHKWCQKYIILCENTIIECVSEEDFLSAQLILATLYDVIYRILEPFAPVDAKNLENSTKLLEEFINKYDYGRESLMVLPAMKGKLKLLQDKTML